MGDSPVFNTIKNVAGYGVGTLAALDTIKGGGLGNYLLNRQRLISDPSYRATLVDSPFMSGVMGLSQGPAPAAPAGTATGGVVQPADMVGPPAPGAAIAAPQDVRYLPTGGHWYPATSPLDYTSQVKAEQDRATMIGLTSTDPGIRTQSKLAIGVPLSTDELDQAVGAGRHLVGQAGPGSQVQYRTQWGGVTVGSPYIAGNYLDQNAAAVVAARTGGVVVPSPTGGFEVKTPERPVQGEYTDPAQAAAVRQPGEVTKPTGRTINGVPTYQNVKQEPAGVAPLGGAKTPAAAPRPPANVPTQPAAPVPDQPGPYASGYVLPSTPPSQPSAAAAPPPPPPPPPPHRVVRQLPDGSFAPVVPPTPPAPAPVGPQTEAEAPDVVATAPAPPLLAAAAPPALPWPAVGAPLLAAAAPPGALGLPAAGPSPVMVATSGAPPPYALVSGAELSGIASGAPPAPTGDLGLRAAPPSALPWVPVAGGQPGPALVRTPGVAVAAPGAPTPPPGAPAGTRTFTETQPIKPEAGGGTVTFAGQVGTEPPKQTTSTRANLETRTFANELGIDTMHPQPGDTELLDEHQLDLQRREAEVQADVARLYGKIPEQEQLVKAYNYRSYVTNLLTEFTPEQRAQYVGLTAPTMYAALQPWRNDPDYARFVALNAGLRSAVFAEGGRRPPTAPEMQVLGPILPSGRETSPASYEAALRVATDKIDNLITGLGAVANMRVADLTPEQQQKIIGQYLSGPSAIHYGPYPFDQPPPAPAPSTTTSTQPTPSPFVVDNLYTLPAPTPAPGP